MGLESQLSHAEAGLWIPLTTEKKRLDLLALIDCAEEDDGKLAPRSCIMVSKPFESDGFGAVT
jgi:hypothetical protein